MPRQKKRRFFARRLLAGLSAAFAASLAACAAKAPPVALTWVDSTRMEVIFVDPSDPLPESEKNQKFPYESVAPFSFEPHWNASRTLVAFTRIDPLDDSVRILSVYDREDRSVRDIAVMGVPEWNRYGFAPAWRPNGRALAFKMHTDKQSGVFVALLDEQRVAQLLPDPAHQIRELAWGEGLLAFNVAIGEPDSEKFDLKLLPLPPPAQLGAEAPLKLAAKASSLGPGILPIFHGGDLYYVRPLRQAFEIVRRKKIVGGLGEPETILSPVGPFFDIAPDGAIAYQSDPDGGNEPVQLTLREPGAQTPRVSTLSSYRFKFSADGKKLVGVRLAAGNVFYFIYERETGRFMDLIMLSPNLSSSNMAEFLDRPLFDW